MEQEQIQFSSGTHGSSSRQQAVGRCPPPSSRRFTLPNILRGWNRLIESDVKSLNSIQSGHSRRSSEASQLSESSLSSRASQQITLPEEDEDEWMVWGRVVNEWDLYIKKKNTYVLDLVRKGIPQHFRSMVWQLLCNAQNCSARDSYSEYIKSPSPCEKVICRDIARTYPEHEYFRDKNGPGQEGLFNVMKAYSLHDMEVGYCQGSAFIVGLLLLQMPEEDAFAVLVKLMEDYRLREMYKPSMAKLGLCMYQLECMLAEHIPELHRHFHSQNFHTSLYASSWFLTLFTSPFPLNLASRVMDLFLSEGMEMIFRISLAILQFCKEDLLQLDMEGMLRYFQKEMPSKCDTDPDYLVSLALQTKYNAKKMKRLEKDYTALKIKEHEEFVELRRLRTENKILKERIEHLEQESDALATRLLEGQVIRAEEEEDKYTITRELQALRYQEQVTSQELEKAKQRIKELNELSSQPPSLEPQTIDILCSLQEEVVAVKLKDVESQETMKELRQRVLELEESNKQMRESTPDNCVATLQEELLAVKLREAEANLVVKELRQTVTDLQIMWKKYLDESSSDHLTSLKKKEQKSAICQLQEDLMSARLSEAEAVAELKELRQKVMELETQNQVSLNQIRRQAEQVQILKQHCEDATEKDKDFHNQLKEEGRKVTDLESKIEEERMMSRIREVEHTQTIAELKQKVSSLEVKNQEMVTVGQLQGSSDNDEVKDLQDKVADLKAEVMRLEVLNKKLASALAMRNLRQDSLSSRSSSTSDGSTGRTNGFTFSRSASISEDVMRGHLLQQEVDEYLCLKSLAH